LVQAARAMWDTTPTMKLLIPHGATQEDKVQALFAVAEQVVVVLVEAAPQKGQSPAPKQPDAGQSPTPWGADSVKKVELLLDSGVNVNARDKIRNNATPLIWAAEFGNTEVVRLLLKKGARVDATDKYGATALIAAACNCAISDMPDTIDSMRLLLAKGANVEAQAKDGSTALMIAAGAGQIEIARLLLQEGAMIEAKDSSGDTPLMHAVTSIRFH